MKNLTKTTKTKTTKTPKTKKPTLEENVDKLIEIMNPGDSFMEALKYMIAKLFSTSPIIAERAFNIFVRDDKFKALKAETKRIYLENYTEAEIERMLHFYGSEEGLSIMNKMPKVTLSLSESSRNWSLRMVEESKDEIEAMIEDQIAMDAKKAEVRIEEAEEMENLAAKRYDFSQKYISFMGWDSKNLTHDQINEIRSQEGWQEPK